MRRILMAAAASAALFTAGAANASVTVSIFLDQAGAANNATLAQLAALGGIGAADATITAGALDFTNSFGNSDVSTVADFLNNPAGLSAAIGNHALDNTYLYITGNVFLHAGANPFGVSHDDGLQLNIDGIGMVVNAPGPTGPVLTPFNVNAPSTGTYNFQLSYGECCGGPAELILDLRGGPVGGTPEPATWAMMLIGFGGLGAMLRSRRRQTVAATA